METRSCSRSWVNAWDALGAGESSPVSRPGAYAPKSASLRPPKEVPGPCGARGPGPEGKGLKRCLSRLQPPPLPLRRLIPDNFGTPSGAPKPPGENIRNLQSRETPPAAAEKATWGLEKEKALPPKAQGEEAREPTWHTRKTPAASRVPARGQPRASSAPPPGGRPPP